MATQPTQQTQSTTFLPSAEQKRLMELTMPGIEQFAAQGGFKPYEGQTVAGFDPTQVSAQERALGTLDQTDALARNAASATNYWAGGGNVWDPQQNAMLQGAQTAAIRPITEDLLYKALPSIRTGDIMTGGYGGSRGQGQEIQALEAASRAAGDTSNKLVMDLYKTNVDAQLRAAGMAPEMQQAQLFGAKTQSAVGDARQALTQAQLSDAANKDYMRQFAPLVGAQEIAGLIGSFPGGTNVSTASNPDQPDAWKKALGGVASGATLGATLGSAVPGIGTALGAGLGGLAGGAIGWFG